VEIRLTVFETVSDDDVDDFSVCLEKPGECDVPSVEE
jgi:hypothetical protein